jgi:hypothetical protein
MKGASHVDAASQYAHNAGCLTGVRKWLEHDVSRLRAGFDEV